MAIGKSSNSPHLQQTRPPAKKDINFISETDDVLYQSLLTLIYRAMPIPEGSSSAFIPQCITSARSALQLHDNIMALIKPLDSWYIHTYFQW